MIDEHQIKLWKAALALCDGRMRWPRALAKAIRMIEARDRHTKQLRNAGQQCSNVCFNLGQLNNLPASARESAQNAARVWDDATKA